MHPKRDHDPCETPPRSQECLSRLEIMLQNRLQQLETQEVSVPAAGDQVRSLFNRSVCIPDELTTSNVLQLETGPSSSYIQCSFNPMERASIVHVASVCSNTPLSEQTSGGANFGRNKHQQTMIVPVWPNQSWSPPYQESLQCAVTIAIFSGHCHKSRWPNPSIDASGVSASRHLAYVRQFCRTEGLSGGGVITIIRSWRIARVSVLLCLAPMG